MAGDVAFQISLQDDVSPAASSAARSLASVEASLKQAADAMTAMAARMSNVSSASARLSSDERAAARSIAAAERAAAKAAKEAEKLAKAQEKEAAKKLAADEKAAAKAMNEAAKAAAKEAAEQKKLAREQEKAAEAAKKQSQQGVAGAFQAAGGPLGEYSEKLGKVKEALSTGAGAAAAAAVVVALVGAAAIAGTIAFIKFGIAAADAAQHLRAVATAQTGSVQAGKELADAIGNTAIRSGVAADELSGYAKKLHDAGVSGRDMQHALAAAAGSSKLLGSSAAEAFVDSAIEAKKAGRSVAEFAVQTKAKLGPGLAIELNRPTVALERLGASISDLFSGADISGFGSAINMVSDALAKGSAVGDAFRAIFEALFGGLGGGAMSAGEVVTTILEHITIMALKVAIFVKPAARALSELWAKMTEGSDRSSTLASVAAVIGVVFAGFAVAAGLCVVLLVSFVGTVSAAVAMIGVAVGAVIALTVAIVGGLVAAIAAIPGMFAAAWAAVKAWATTGYEAAKDFAQGLVNGIVGGTGMVVDAIKNLASSALGAFKGMLGIASPSKVMLQMGGYTAEGFAGGMDAGAAVVESSASTLAAAPIEAAQAAPPAALPAPRAAGGGGGGGSIDIGGVQITINGVAGAEAILEKLPAALADAFEQIAETMGIQPAEA